jgi:hypothetical protein
MFRGTFAAPGAVITGRLGCSGSLSRGAPTGSGGGAGRGARGGVIIRVGLPPLWCSNDGRDGRRFAVLFFIILFFEF